MSEEKSLFRFFKREHWLNSNNRWEPQDDEFAVAFRLDELRGMLNTRLVIPHGTRAWAQIDNKVEEYQEGNVTLENFVSRLNSAIQRKHGEVLITRKAALAVPFEFSGIYSSELLAMDVTLSLNIQVGGQAAFRNHFMRHSGPVKVAHLQSLLDPVVGQVVKEFCITRSLEVLQSTHGLRGQLMDLINQEMGTHFDEYGLEFDGVETLSLIHNKTEAEQLSDKDADELYTRVRRLDQLEKIAQADTREQAIAIGARDEIETLERQYARKRRLREQEALGESFTTEDKATEWRHMQELAAIRHQFELEAAKARADNERTLERTRCKAQLEWLDAEESVRRAEFLEDAEERSACRRRETERRDAAATRLDKIEEARNQLAVTEIEITIEARQREAKRIQIWEDQVLEGKKRRANDDQDIDALGKLNEIKRRRHMNEVEVEDYKKRLKAGRKQSAGSQENSREKVPEPERIELGEETDSPSALDPRKELPTGKLEERKFQINEGDTGYGYLNVIAPYLAGATFLEIDDPYINLHHQIQNFVIFCEMVVRSGTVKRVTLRTKLAGREKSKVKLEGEQKERVRSFEKKIENFEILKGSLRHWGVALEVHDAPNLHHREIRLDNGWVIEIDRGLDYFDYGEGASFKVGSHDVTLRKCKLTNVRIFRKAQKS